jgi:hypothetical protein
VSGIPLSVPFSPHPMERIKENSIEIQKNVFFIKLVVFRGKKIKTIIY